MSYQDDELHRTDTYQDEELHRTDTYQDEELHRTDTRCATLGVKDLDVEPHMIDKLCCVICKNPASKSESLQEVGKGIQTLLTMLLRYLLETQTSNTRVKIHHACQKSAYNELKRKCTNPSQGASSSKMHKPKPRCQ